MTSCQLLISICGKISCNLDLKLGKISHIASIYIGNLHVSLHWGCTKSPTVLTMEVEHLSWVSLNSLRKKFPPKSEMDLQTGGCSMFKVFLPTNPRSLEYLGWLFPWSCNFLLIRSRTPTKPDSEHLWTPHFLKETYWIVFFGHIPPLYYNGLDWVHKFPSGLFLWCHSCFMRFHFFFMSCSATRGRSSSHPALLHLLLRSVQLPIFTQPHSAGRFGKKGSTPGANFSVSNERMSEVHKLSLNFFQGPPKVKF